MRSVIERHGYHVDEQRRIRYDDRQSTYEVAEKIAGRRLDRRKHYAIIDGQVCDVAEWSDDCSGCTDVGDFGAKYGPTGCRERGYTGRRRHSEWVPLMDGD